MGARVVAGALLVALASCQRGPAGPGNGAASSSSAALAPSALAEQRAIRDGLAELRKEEAELRSRTDFRHLAPSSRSLGPNPYALAAVAGTTRFVGILRGDSRLVLLDEGLTELASVATAPSPSALASVGSGDVLVAGPLAPLVERFRVRGAALEPRGALALPPATVARALVADERALVVADFAGDGLLSLPLAAALAPGGAAEPHRTSTCQGPLRLALTSHHVAVSCLFDHTLLVLERDPSGEPGRELGRIVHDGPIWSLALLERPGELWIAAGGVEDHPLDRRDRAFGYIDSFSYLYTLAPDGTLRRRLAEDLGEAGVTTPKTMHLAERAGVPVLTTFGYASGSALELGEGRPSVVQSSIPGCADVLFAGGRRLCANPLLDAWVELPEQGEPRLHPVRAAHASEPSPEERLGEALFFTTLMAPDGTSSGRRSRFTCETCHFEGATDGRVHNSGRENVRVSTRPLFGLFNDAPHFSRAHDRDLTSVCHNEFAVANRGTAADPWFSLDVRRFPWLGALGVAAGPLEPLALRRALFAFLARFSHEENPFGVRHPAPRRFTSSERSGAELFERRCARCHAARLVASNPTTLVPSSEWEQLVLADEGPIVWARGDYERTGVLPYVDPEGTRIPSLRRLYLKRPYFTDGSARTLADVLARARFDERTFFHAEPTPVPPGLQSLTPAEASALLDFVRLL
jgi:hypothetical protein